MVEEGVNDICVYLFMIEFSVYLFMIEFSVSGNVLI